MSGSTLSFLDLFWFLWSSNSVVVRLCVHYSFVKRHNNWQTHKNSPQPSCTWFILKLQKMYNRFGITLQQSLLRRAAPYWKHMLAGPSLVVSKYILMIFCLGTVDIGETAGVVRECLAPLWSKYTTAMQQCRLWSLFFCGLGLLFVCHVCQLLQC